MSVYKLIFKSLIIVCFFWIAFGFYVPSYEWYVTDKVGVFSETEKTDLNAKIEEIEKTTSIEIAVLVVPTVDDDINLAAVDVGNARWVGKEGQNNWVVLLIAIDDRKRSIQVWYGLEWTIPDLIADRMGETNFPPNFREGNYYQGIVGMIDDFLWYIANDPTIVQTYEQDTSSTSPNEDYLGIIFIVLFFVIGGFGRRVTVPKVKGTWRKMKKHGRWIYAWVGLIFSLLITRVISSFIIAAFMSYMFLLFWILVALAGKATGGGKGIRFGGSGGSRWWWGSSFGWFWGGSFGGGGSSGSR